MYEYIMYVVVSHPLLFATWTTLIDNPSSEGITTSHAYRKPASNQQAPARTHSRFL